MTTDQGPEPVPLDYVNVSRVPPERSLIVSRASLAEFWTSTLITSLVLALVIRASGTLLAFALWNVPFRFFGFILPVLTMTVLAITVWAGWKLTRRIGRRAAFLGVLAACWAAILLYITFVGL